MKITKNPTTKAIIPELRGNLGAIRYPCFAEIKYDGEATVIMYDLSWPDKIITTNKYGTMRSDWSKLDDIADILEVAGIKKCTMLAELYYGDGKAGALYELLSHKDDDNLNLVIYDIVHIVNDEDIDGTKTPLLDRKEILSSIFGAGPYAIRSMVMHNKKEVEKFFEAITLGDYEGIVVKNFDGNLTNGPCDWAKMKKKDQSDYRVTRVSLTQERIEIAVPCPASLPRPAYLHYVNVGVKCCNKDKKNLLVGDLVTIEHQGVLPSGSLRHPVFIGKVKEK